MQTTRQLITRILTLCLLLLAAGRNVMFAYSSEALRNLRLGDGQPGETVYKTMTDHGGRVWIATSSGISVFNGQRLSSFSLNDENGRSLAVFDICQTRDKTIYASTEKGLYRMRHDGDGFSRILPEIEKPESLLACGDTVYIAGRHGFMLYDGRRLTTRMIGASNSGLDNIVRHYITTDDGMVWYLSRFNLHRFNLSTGKTSTIVLGDMLPEKVVHWHHLRRQGQRLADGRRRNSNIQQRKPRETCRHRKSQRLLQPTVVDERLYGPRRPNIHARRHTDILHRPRDETFRRIEASLQVQGQMVQGTR